MDLSDYLKLKHKSEKRVLDVIIAVLAVFTAAVWVVPVSCTPQPDKSFVLPLKPIGTGANWGPGDGISPPDSVFWMPSYDEWCN